MNKLTQSGALIVIITAMLSGACKKEVHDAAQADSANPEVTATRIEANAGYRPEILGSIREPRGVYSRFDFGPTPPYSIYNSAIPMTDAGSITVTANYKPFVYRIHNGDEVLVTSKSSALGAEITIIGVDKAQNSQITIRLSVIGTFYTVEEVTFKFDGLDALGVAPSVVEYNSFGSGLPCFGRSIQGAQTNGKVKVKGVFYGGMIYRAGTWTSRSDIVVSGSFNIDPPKI